MKVSCQQCGASYSVADEKVAGRSLRLRCKKCGESIQVDGKSLAQAPREPVVPAASRPPMTRAPVTQDAGAEWHVAVGDTTQGPYTLDEIAEYYADGSIVLDTLLYREGWTDWAPAGEVEALQEAAGALLARPTPPAPPSPAAQARRGTMGSDPFAEPSIPVASPRVSAAEMLSVGPQHEGTVQFSVDQIRALSAVSAPSSLPATPAKPGYASGSGSGLIDMASLVREESEAEQKFEPISFGQASPLDTIAPMSLPVMPQSAGLDFRTKALAGVAALGFALAGGIGVLAVTRRPAPVPPVALSAVVAPTSVAPQAVRTPPPQAALAAMVAAPVQPAHEVAVEPPAPREPAASKPSARHKSATKASIDDTPQVASKSQKHGGKHSGDKADDLDLIAKSSSEKSSSGKSSAEKPSAKASSADIDDLMVKNPPKTAGPKKGGSASIDELLDDAVSAKKQPPKSEPAPEPKSDLPKTPSRDEMLASLAKAAAKAKSCKGEGVALAVITITGKSGRATGVSVSGVEGPGRSCVENAVRSTPFPKFQKDDFQVKFPFKLGG